MVNTVVVSGPKSCGKKFVLSQLVGDAKTKDWHIEDIKAHSLVLNTKYYTADVDVCLIQQDAITWTDQKDKEQKEAKKTEEKVRPTWVNTEHLSECQALILVFDFHDQETFKSLEKWESFIEEHSPSVMLVVANRKKKTEPPSLDEQKKLNAFAEKCREWALDNGLEYLDLPFILENGEKSAAEEDESSDHHELVGLQDKFGVDRIREALEANMWSELTMKDYKRGARRSSTDEEEEEDDASIEGGDTLKVLEGSVEEGKTQASEASSDVCGHCLKTTEELDKKLLRCSRCKLQGYCCSEHQKLHWKTHKPQCKTPDEQKFAFRAALQAVHQQPKEGDEESSRDVESDMASFEALFDRMQSIRNNQSNMSDVDRRAHAEKAIKDLLAMEGMDMADL